MKFVSRSCPVVVWLVVMVAALVSPAALGEESVADWASDNSVLFVGTSNWDGLTEAFKKTRLHRSMEDADVKEAVGPWKKLLENAQGLVAKKLGLEDPKELELWPHGGVAVFVPLNMDAADVNDQAHVCVVADMGADAGRARTLAGKVVQHCVEQGAERTVEESGGSEIVIVKFKSKPKSEPDADANADSDADADSAEEPAEDAGFAALLEGVELDKMQLAMITGVLGQLEPPDRFAYAFAGERVVLASSQEVVKQTLARMKSGSEGSLGAVRDVRAFSRRMEGKPDVLFVLNIPVFMNADSKRDPDSGKINAALSMDAFGPLLVGVQLAPSKEIDIRTRGFMRIDERPHGLGRILRMQNVDTVPPTGVSADTALYASLNVDPSLVLDEVVAISEQIDPDTAESIRSSLKVPQEDNSVLDIKNDIVGQLAGPLAVSIGLAKPFGAEQFTMLVRLGHKSRDAMTKLAAMLPKGMFEATEILGHTVYQMAAMEGMALGFTDRAVIPFATRGALENYIRSEGQAGRGLAQTPAFQSAVRHVPAQSAGMVYVDGALITDAQIALAEEAAAGKTAENENMSLQDYMRQGMMGSYSQKSVKLLKAARKYQSYLIATMSTESEGLLFDVVQVPALEQSGE